MKKIAIIRVVPKIAWYVKLAGILRLVPKSVWITIVRRGAAVSWSAVPVGKFVVVDRARDVTLTHNYCRFLFRLQRLRGGKVEGGIVRDGRPALEN